MADTTPNTRATATRNGTGDGEQYNPYARDRRVQFNHRLPETFSHELAATSGELEDRGWPRSQASIAELLQAVLHFHAPKTAEEAEALLGRWGVVKSLPPLPADDE